MKLPLSSSHGVSSYEAISNVLVSWFGNSVMVDGLIGGCETKKLILEKERGWGRWFVGWGWDWQWLVVMKQKHEIRGDRWVERFDGYDLVLMGWWVFIFYLFFSYGFDRFNLRLVAFVLILVSLFWLVCWVSRTWTIMFWEEYEQSLCSWVLVWFGFMFLCILVQIWIYVFLCFFFVKIDKLIFLN